jgi:hypothetical protein
VCCPNFAFVPLAFYTSNGQRRQSSNYNAENTRSQEHASIRAAAILIPSAALLRRSIQALKFSIIHLQSSGSDVFFEMSHL